MLKNSLYELKRTKEIIFVLAKYGFGDLIESIGIPVPYKKSPNISRSERIRRAIEELGPTFIKLAQILSLRPDLVPLELAKEFEKLQDNVTPLPFDVMKKVLEEELDRDYKEIFYDDFTLLASASIGQVYKATLRSGEVVAVKILKPGIEEKIYADIAILMRLARMLRERFLIYGIDLVKIIEEFANSIKKELDFNTEALNLKRFAVNFIDNPNIKVPKFYEKYSTKRVLIMEYIDGIKISDIDKLKKADEKIMVKPLEEKLDLLKKKESALSQFVTIGSTVKTDILDLADGTLFAKVSANVNGSSVNVTANDGVKPQTFDINVTQLAQNDVYQSKGFASKDSSINSSGNDQKISIGIGDSITTITLHSGATLNDLKEAINNANAGVTASIIDTGIGDNPYKLVLKANDTGNDNYIQFNYSGIEDLGLNAINYTSATYTSDTDSVNNSGSNQTFSIDVNGTTYSMTVADGTTVSDFINALNNGELKDSKGNSLSVNASYNSNTGAISFDIQTIGNININDNGLTTVFNNNTDFSNSNRLQTAQDAVFDYNGVEVHRSSNTIEDLITGVKIELQNTGKSTVNISSNIDDMVDAIKKFVADYNQMISNLQSLTAYDKDTGNVGLFQGDSDFTMLESRFSNDIFGVVLSNKTTEKDLNGNEYTLSNVFTASDVGFSINKTGMISFDEEKFKEAFNKDSDLTNRLFGDMFTRLKTDFESTITGDHSNLNLLDQELKSEEDRYHDRVDAMNKYLETKYEIMAKQFAAYDEMINKLNVQTQVLQQTIEAAIAAKK